MATIYLRLSKRKNAFDHQEVILTFRHGKTIYQRAGTGIYIADKPMYWDGKNMVFRARSMTEEARYHRTQKERLEKLCNYINERWLETDKQIVSPTWLKDTIDSHNHPIVKKNDVDVIGIMESEDVGACLGEGFEVFLGFHNHQVNIQRLLGFLLNRLNDRDSEGDVRHETTVHHIAMEPIGLASVDHLNVAFQVQEVG